MPECCNNPDNREPGPGPRGGDIPDGLEVTHCTECGCRHFEAEAEPAELGLLGSGM